MGMEMGPGPLEMMFEWARYYLSQSPQRTLRIVQDFLRREFLNNCHAFGEMQ
jgi:hypothetical protein